MPGSTAAPVHCPAAETWRVVEPAVVVLPTTSFLIWMVLPLIEVLG
jgi:hypothetical protein